MSKYKHSHYYMAYISYNNIYSLNYKYRSHPSHLSRICINNVCNKGCVLRSTDNRCIQTAVRGVYIVSSKE